MMSHVYLSQRSRPLHGLCIGSDDLSASHVHTDRRGAILLVVLGLLALFALMAVTFVIIARQHLTNSLVAAKIEAHRDPPDVLTNEALLQILRGTNNPASVVGHHSLLEDMYGPGETGAISAYSITTGNAGFDAPDIVDGNGRHTPAAQILTYHINLDSGVPVAVGYYDGRVLTMLTGRARGKSTRIVGFRPHPLDTSPNLSSTTNWVLMVMAFKGSQAPEPNDRFLINSRPFNGPGFGFPDQTINPTEFISYSQDGLLDAVVPVSTLPNDLPWALLPNHTDPDIRNLLVGPDNAIGTIDDYKIFADEDYDAPDYQNMALAMRISPGPGFRPIVVRPSFHDPALVNYWKNRFETVEGGTAAEWQDDGVSITDFASTDPSSIYLDANSLKRKIFMRPLVEDHPNFAVVNPAFDPSHRQYDPLNPDVQHYRPGFVYNPALPNNLPPWDVDNLGDGVPDSVWVDIGLPVQVTADGREYKPLAAYLILDMDGKLNINVHGTTSQLAVSSALIRDQLSFAPVSSHQLLGDPVSPDTTIRVPLGMGMSVAEVNLSADLGGADGTLNDWGLFRGYASFPAFAASATLPLEAPEYVQVLHGRPNITDTSIPLIPGRYGEAYLLDPNNNSSGLVVFPQAGMTNLDDNTPVAPVDRVLNTFAGAGSNPLMDLRGDQWVYSPHGRYRSPPDVDGDGFVVLGGTGHPLYGPSFIGTNPAFPRDPSVPKLFGSIPISDLGSFCGFGGTAGGPYGILMDSDVAHYLNKYQWPNRNSDLNMGEAGLPSETDPFRMGQRDAIDDPMELNVAMRGSQRRMPVDLGAHQSNTIGFNVLTDPNNAANKNAAIDQPYTAEDLEWILRPYDTDSRARSSRLAKLAPFFATDIFRRSLATTDSWDVPSPSFTVPQSLAKRLQASGNINVTPEDKLRLLSDPSLVDLLRVVLTNKITTPITTAQIQQINVDVAKMLPPSLIAGLRFDINRPFGNGFDDNDNGVVDEPREWADPMLGPEFNEKLWRGSNLNGGMGIDFDHDRKGVVGNKFAIANPGVVLPPNARYQYARYLYVLMMLLADVDPTATGSYRVPLATGDVVLEPQLYELTARRIAQWAVNVVDFRDPDVIMTGFEFDLYPFNGWHVDGYLPTNELKKTGARVDRAVVWGCERPELLITETMAFHDRGGFEDRDDDDSPGPADNAKFLAIAAGGTNPMGTDLDLDQVRRSQGSLFIELYNPWNMADVRDYPMELYSIPANGHASSLDAGRDLNRSAVNEFNNPTLPPYWYGGVDLSRLALPRIPGVAATRAPVWRLLIAESSVSATGKHIEVNPNRASQEPLQPDLTDPSVLPVTVERVVWFITSADVTAFSLDPNGASNGQNYGIPAGAVVYYNNIGIDNVGTPKWNTSGFNSSTDYENKVGFTNLTQEFLVKPGHYAVIGPRVTTNIYGAVVPAGQIQMHNTTATAFWSSLPSRFIRFPQAIRNTLPTAPDNIKSPLSIVINEPHALNISEPLNKLQDPYRALAQVIVSPDKAVAGPNPDALSITPAPGSSYTDRYNTPLDNILPPPPGFGLNENKYGAQGQKYKTIYLQRLANPLWAWNPPVGQTGHMATLPVNPYRTIDWMHVDLFVYNAPSPTTMLPQAEPMADILTSRERGDLSLPGVPPLNLWSQMTDPLAGSIATPGFANRPFGGLSSIWNRTDIEQKVGVPSMSSSPYVAAAIGEPKHAQKFPWLTWNNRPFTSNMELLMVPTSSSARLLWEYTMKRGSDDSFDQDPSWAKTNGYPYSHLQNFFISSSTNTGISNINRSNFHRVLEFVHVPSRFSGTQTMLNPEVFGTNGLGQHPFHPPYNYVSTYREPGRVNINTIFDDGHTWRGVMNRFDETSTDGADVRWLKIIRSRRGYDEGAAIVIPNPAPPGVISQIFMQAMTQGDTLHPSLISNPFRSPASNFNVPIASMRQVSGVAGKLVDSTLLRRDPVIATQPLFAFDSIKGHNNTNRNPYFRYQAFQKLGNVLTTRSNVYAIWVTVGFFEVTRGKVDAAHPDGYYLGPELGSDTGDIKRHRSFSIFDRSVPVGFERGEDHNVLDGMLLHRTLD